MCKAGTSPFSNNPRERSLDPRQGGFEWGLSNTRVSEGMARRGTSLYGDH